MYTNELPRIKRKVVAAEAGELFHKIFAKKISDHVLTDISTFAITSIYTYTYLSREFVNQLGFSSHRWLLYTKISKMGGLWMKTMGKSEAWEFTL